MLVTGRKVQSMGVVLSALVLAALPAAPSNLEMRLEAAIHREIVRGDLKGAVDEYRALIAAGSKSRPITARALFQLGRCLEKTGRPDEARSMYARVVKEYGDQAGVAEQARAQLAGSDVAQPGPRNLRFERGRPGKVPPGWFVPALAKDADTVAELRRSDCRSGIGCAVVVAPVNAPSPFGSLMQSFGAAPYRGRTIRLSAWLRIEASGAGDSGQMWLSVDRMSRQSEYLNMNQRTVQSAEWTLCEIESAIAEDATFINFGIMAFGRGRVWVDGVSFEVLPGGSSSRATR